MSFKGNKMDGLVRVAGIVASQDGSPVAFDGKYVWAFQNAEKPPLPTGKGAEGEGVLLPSPSGKVAGGEGALLPSPSGRGAGGEGDSSQPQLLVLDPATAKRWFLTPADGLPEMTLRNVSIAPLEIGKVCVLGHFGEQRMTRVWFGIAQFDPRTGKGSVAVFHDARDMPPVRHGEEWKDTHLAFSRSRITTLTEPNVGSKPRRRVVVDRAYGYPLLIDPETLAIKAPAEDIVYWLPGFPIEHQGALYWLARLGANEYRVCRFGFPDFKIQQGEQSVSFGLLAFHRQWTVLVDAGGDMWMAAQPLGPFHRLRTEYAGDGRPSVQNMRIFANRDHDLLLYDTGHSRVYEIVFPSDTELARTTHNL